MVLLLLVSAALTLIVTVGGWGSLQGAKVVSIMFIIVFVVMAYFVWRWNRGVLPLAAGLGVILGVFAAIAALGSGSWFDRSEQGYDKSGQLPPDLIGTLCIVLLPVLLLLIAFAMRAFAQKWNIEIEMSREEYDRRHRGGDRGGGYGRAQPA